MWGYLGLTIGFGLLLQGGPALLVRLVSLPVLSRVQRHARERALEVGEGAAPSRMFPGAVLGEAAVWVGGAVVLLTSMRLLGPYFLGFELLSQSIGDADGRELGRYMHLSFAESRIWFGVGSLPVLLGWLLLWFRTQRTLLTAGLPAGVWRSPSTSRRLAVLFVLRLVLGVFLPVGMLLGALVAQAVALVVARRFRSTTVPVPPAQPGPSVSYGPSAPPVPSYAPVQPPLYVPTQADRSAEAAVATGPAATAQIAHQELYPNEPRTLGGYRLLGRIGAGGMGTVYLAQREGSATQVALKTIHPELLDHAELLRRFERESEVLAMVPGAFTARVLDGGVDSGRPYLVMELLDGRPLDVHLREQGPIRSPEALRAMALALAVALSGVHRLGLVHRDLKPANVMLTSAGPRLLDFGIAAIVDGTRLTRTGGGPGTLTYMAPEQFGEERAGPAADVWAWACCVVCAAHGTSPFAATSTGAVIRRIVDTGPEASALEAVRRLDPALAAVVLRALTIDPAGRPADGAALVSLLTSHTAPAVVRDQITQGWRTLTL